MNTKYIRKQAIALKLGELLAGTCKYSPDTPAAYHSLIEPDHDALSDFQLRIAGMANRHFHDQLYVKEVQMVYDWCYRIGASVGHVLSQGTTGTWGVRMHELRDIIEVLNIPDFELLPIKSIINLYDSPARIMNYGVSENWLIITYKTNEDNEYENTWDTVVYWKDLEMLRKQ